MNLFSPYQKGKMSRSDKRGWHYKKRLRRVILIAGTERGQLLSRYFRGRLRRGKADSSVIWRECVRERGEGDFGAKRPKKCPSNTKNAQKSVKTATFIHNHGGKVNKKAYITYNILQAEPQNRIYWNWQKSVLK